LATPSAIDIGKGLQESDTIKIESEKVPSIIIYNG
jgi:hypothetical protein